MQHEQGKVIGVIVHMFVDQKKLNRTLAIDSPFQTFAVGPLVEFMDYVALSLHTPETLSSLSKTKISLFNAHLALFVRRMTQLWSHNSIGKYCDLVN